MPVISARVNGFRGFIQTFKFPTLPKGPRAEIATSDGCNEPNHGSEGALRQAGRTHVPTR
jgi:hypothetical protein